MTSKELYLLFNIKFYLGRAKEKISQYYEEPEEPKELQGKQGRLRLDTETSRRKKHVSQ